MILSEEKEENYTLCHNCSSRFGIGFQTVVCAEYPCTPTVIIGFFMYSIQRCIICIPLCRMMLGSNPGLAVRRSNHSARSHPQLGKISSTMKHSNSSRRCQNKSGSIYRKNWSLIWSVFCKEIRRVIEWLEEIKNADQWGTKLFSISSNTANKNFFTHYKLLINDVEIIACKLELFKISIIDFINQEISAVWNPVSECQPGWYSDTVICWDTEKGNPARLPARLLGDEDW